MKMSWHRLGRTTEKAPVVIVALEINEIDFVAARLNGLSESSKLSDKLRALLRIVEDREALGAPDFDLECLSLNERRALYGYSPLEPVLPQLTEKG